MQYDLSDCSIVVPVEVDSIERREHVHFLYAYFKKYFIHHRLIIIEEGKEPQIHLLPSPEVQIEFIPKQEGSLNISALSNQGIELVKTPFFCKCDADSLIHPKAIFDAFERLKQHPDQSFVCPFNGITWDILDPLRKQILQTLDFSSLPFLTHAELQMAPLPNIHLHNAHTAGLIHHFRTSVFKDLGGYNEEFIGWGYEDSEIVHRFQTLGHPRVLQEHFNGFHFAHPRKELDGVQVFKNLCRMQELKDASSDELQCAIQRWSRFKKGNCI